jgi:membrane fusion protein PltH
MKRRLLIGLLALLAVGGSGLAWWNSRGTGPSTELVLYGNVDLRQVQLAFNGSERIAAVLVQEGDPVHKGQLLARLDSSRLELQVAQAEAQTAAQQQVVDKLHHGSRPEEIAQARATVAAARADANNARLQYQRQLRLSQGAAGSVVSQQALDNARAALDVAQARLTVSERALELTVAGPRAEDIAAAEAQLRAGRAQVALLERQLADAQLVSPVDGVVRSRIMEPGEMASAQTPVLSIAITDPKWVRAYVSETELGNVHPGMPASVEVDSFPKQRFKGSIGFISPSAEFTPKVVQTEELRTSLVYEVRVFVEDPQDRLRLGMPATVYLTPGAAPGSAPSTSAASDPAPQTGAAGATSHPARP